MAGRSDEAEERKRAIFAAMSEKRRQKILARGYEQWDPFQEPKEPLDLRLQRQREKAQALMERFWREAPPGERGEAYRQGAWELCMGLLGKEERAQGSFDFACWYHKTRKRGER
jgi:hypothetical protein